MGIHELEPVAPDTSEDEDNVPVPEPDVEAPMPCIDPDDPANT
jgi:hypothetical protein